MNTIVGGIAGLVSCLLCAVPFMIIARFDKDSKSPIRFWRGHEIKDKVVNIPQYNSKMSKLFFKYGLVFVICGICCLFSLVIGSVLVCLAGTIGLYAAYREYKKILDEFS